MSIVYCLSFPNGKQYIGMTSQTMEKRLIGHRAYAKKGCEFLLYSAWRKYGEPECKVLAVVESHMVRKTERKAIAVFGTMVPNGYNLMLGGEGAGIASQETRAKQSLAAKGKPKSEQGRQNIAAGVRNRPYESLANRLGKSQTAEWVEKRAAANRGKKRSPEFRARMSEVAKNRPPWTEERKKQVSESMKRARASNLNWSTRKKPSGE